MAKTKTAGRPRDALLFSFLTVVVALASACGTESLGGPGDDACRGPLCNRAQLDVLGLDPFYEKYVDAEGIPVISSGRTRDEALFAAREIVLGMLESRPDVRTAMIANNARVGIMAVSEVTTDIPEHTFLANDPNVDWDVRARGLGGTPTVPITTAGEENLLCLANDVFRGENILVHEFAHGIHLLGIDFVDVAFSDSVQTLYQFAIADGIWAQTWAETNPVEYWAEGVQSWFDVNQDPQPGIHNHIDTRVEVRSDDPRLAELLTDYFPPTGWMPACPG